MKSAYHTNQNFGKNKIKRILKLSKMHPQMKEILKNIFMVWLTMILGSTLFTMDKIWE